LLVNEIKILAHVFVLFPAIPGRTFETPRVPESKQNGSQERGYSEAVGKRKLE
jgi:hypothetical protein